MARTKKCRRVCCRPACRRFRAQSGTRSVNIPLDELEAMRLVDLEHLEQGEASEKMGVSRGTVQRLHISAGLRLAYRDSGRRFRRARAGLRKTCGVRKLPPHGAYK